MIVQSLSSLSHTGLYSTALFVNVNRRRDRHPESLKDGQEK